MDFLRNNIDIATKSKKAELVIKNGKIINVFTNEIIKADIAINKDTIVGIGNYDGITEIDIEGKYVAPGFIDAHVHIESSMTSPSQFAEAIVPRGTTTIITDPHEIANVCGIKGIEYMLNDSENIPLDVFIMLPSCVPATPFENSGSTLTAKELELVAHHPRVLGLGEVMNYVGVINNDDDLIEKLYLMRNRLIDGHAPSIKNEELNAYITAGITTDHECSTIEEMQEKLRLGMYIHMREGSAAKNLSSLIKGVNESNHSRICFCTDDRHPNDLLTEGHIDNNIRKAIEYGITPIMAIKMATINTAMCYKLNNKGAIAPGYIADIVVLEDLQDIVVNQVYKSGKLVATNNKPLFTTYSKATSDVLNTININPITLEQLKVSTNSNLINVIKLLPHSLITKRVTREVNSLNGIITSQVNQDLLKLVVIERHNATDNIGIGFIEGFGLESGAIASTVAHDSHNLIAVSTNDEDLLLAIKELERVGGGITICKNGKVLHTLALPIGGLMSDMTITELARELDVMLHTAHTLGVSQRVDPFMTLAFLALPVIPDIKLTDQGLFDVTQFKFINLEANLTI